MEEYRMLEIMPDRTTAYPKSRRDTRTEATADQRERQRPEMKTGESMSSTAGRTRFSPPSLISTVSSPPCNPSCSVPFCLLDRAFRRLLDGEREPVEDPFYEECTARINAVPPTSRLRLTPPSPGTNERPVSNTRCGVSDDDDVAAGIF